MKMSAEGVIEMAAGRRRAISGALLVGTFLASLEVMVVSPAMPQVVGEFGGAGLYPWVFSAYVIARTVSIPAWGTMSDRVGRREAYIAGVAFFVGGSVLCALAPSMPALVAGRAVQGLGAGCLVPLTMTIFGDLYPVAERTRMQGVFSLVWGVSSLIGPLAGGVITAAVSWRGIFWLNLIPGVAAAVVVAALFPRRRGGGERKPGGGTLSLLRDPTQQAIVGSGVLIGAGMMGVIGYLPVYVTAVGGGDTLDAGLAIIPLSVAWTLMANVAGRLVTRWGFRRLAVVGVGLAAVGTGIAGLWTANPWGLVLYGAGMGFTISAFNVAAQEAAPLHLRGSATSLTMFSRSTGAAIGVVAFGALAGIEPGAESFADIVGLEAGLERVFVAIAVATALAALTVLVRFPRRVRRAAG